ncbi:unnamed protein product [Ranitomeya imitator]|uniref:Ion transport domain-containing protein n=1 Tax=Ranitomeya imitator TaxID=111125 RepID=A0ABN9KS62_9NEOB|nr:unnamed protein product [Ranitomeya imitator]
MSRLWCWLTAEPCIKAGEPASDGIVRPMPKLPAADLDDLPKCIQQQNILQTTINNLTSLLTDEAGDEGRPLKYHYDNKLFNMFSFHRIIEAICIGWFTAECIVRFIVSKNKCDFVKRPLNIIDMLAISPYYVSVLMTLFTGENSQLQRAGMTLRVLRMMRIFWVIKLARHFIGLQTLGLTLKRCYREMVMLLVFICVAMAIFGALAQLLEHGLDLESKNEDYSSIPAACWWVIISMTTVGYGDMYPISIPGRILGGVCVVSGIVLLALPITFIYHSFVQCYHELKFKSAKYSRTLSNEYLN